jgi:hypothetical protein
MKPVVRDWKHWKELEQLGADLDEGRRISFFKVMLQIAYEYPTLELEKASELAREILDRSDGAH